MLFRDPRVLAFVLIAIGGGLLTWYGPQWYQLPRWSETDVEDTVEQRLETELAQRGPLLQPTGERLELLRSTLRGEVQGQIRRERRDVERWLAAGLLLCVLGIGALVRSRLWPSQAVDRSRP